MASAEIGAKAMAAAAAISVLFVLMFVPYAQLSLHVWPGFTAAFGTLPTIGLTRLHGGISMKARPSANGLDCRALAGTAWA
jgi:hypothetical protein